MLQHLHSEKVLPMSQTKGLLLQFKTITTCFVPCSHREYSITILFILTLQGFQNLSNLLNLFSRLTELRSFNLQKWTLFVDILFLVRPPPVLKIVKESLPLDSSDTPVKNPGLFL